jgi:hypothetical protein
VILDAHGIQVKLPPGWSGRIFTDQRHVATLHAGNFALALHEQGEFGDRSTSAMHPGHAFVALTEYIPGAGLEPGVGLFSSHRIPLPLDPTRFSTRCLAHPRHDQVGMQHFFTAAGRPFCLYVVLAGRRSHRHHQLAAVDHVLRSLHFGARPRGH